MIQKKVPFIFLIYFTITLFFTINALSQPGKIFSKQESTINQNDDFPWVLFMPAIQKTNPKCGAYVALGVWKIFDCYNLAAIGKTTNDDPFTPSWRLIGGYWQWGRKGPDASQWHSTNTANFAHGPTDPEAGNANDDAITGWDTTYAPDDSWSDASKTTNDPCPAGFRVPTSIQWDGVLNNNTQSTTGTWDSSDTNYSSARFFGDDLMLPAAGYRYHSSGSLGDRGYLGYYWSSSQQSTSADAWNLYFNSSNAGASNTNRRIGFPVRCVAEDTSPVLSVTPATQNVNISSGITTFSVSNPSTYTMAWTATVTSGSSWLDITSGSSGSNSGTITCGYSVNMGGALRIATIRITAAGAIGSPMDVMVIQAGNCGAYIAPGVWREFDCYNLAAIGKTTSDDPFTPSWRLIGGYWQWGRKGPDANQWYNTNTSNFAHGPTGSASGEANDGAITGWDTTYALDDSWSDASKTVNDPCPAGYRVPTSTQWEGVKANNTQSIIWGSAPMATNYGSALFFGNGLMLPVAGYRSSSSGLLSTRGSNGYYWSSSQCSSSSSAWALAFYSGHINGAASELRRNGFSVRCVAE